MARMSEKITIGLLQLRSVSAAPDGKAKGKNAGGTPAPQAEANLTHVSDKIREAAKRGAQIV